MVRTMLQLAAWCGLAAGVFIMLFGTPGSDAAGTGGLLGAGPWAAVGVALIGLGVCVNAVTQVRSTTR